MPEDRRRHAQGNTHFFTVHLADADACTLCLEIDLLRECYGAVVRAMPFRTDAIVILPNHLHAIWTLPSGDMDHAERWRRIKVGFRRQLHRKYPGTEGFSAGSEDLLWQTGYWHHAIRDAADLRRHRRYCWTDPVRHDLVDSSEDWAFSSFYKRGWPDADRRVAVPEAPFPAGERDDEESGAQASLLPEIARAG